MAWTAPMLAVVDWLLGLERLSVSDGAVEIGWRYPIPGWGWALIFLAAFGLTAYAYHRQQAPRWSRLLLAGARGLILLLIVVLIAGPMLVLPQERIEPDALILLVDRSASMQVRDVQEGSVVLSREQSLRQALANQREVFGPGGLGHERQLLWLGFDAQAYDMPSPLIQGLAAPQGQMTHLRSAIEQGLEQAAGRPISGIVLLTDGRSGQTTSGALVRRLEQQAVSVFPVPLGAATPPLDLAIGRVDAPERAFVNDTVPVRVWVDQYPIDAAVEPSDLLVRLIDVATGQVLDERAPTASHGAAHDPVTLQARSAAAGPATWEVEVTYSGPTDQGRRELVSDNNSRQIAIDLIDRPLRVLYVEGYPRWEYRYLKNMLVREQSILASIMLISADPTFAQEGDVPIGRLPQTVEEIRDFDVIIIGDVPAGHFSQEQLGLLRDHVATAGAGLLWIGGSRALPRSYESSPLADLLPMRRPGATGRLEPVGREVLMVPTPLAEALNVLRLEDPQARGNSSASVWPQALAPLQWVQDVGALKPAAEVLAVGQGVPPAEPPLLVRLRYGAGQSLYLATDETWRWRFGRGDLYFDQFWTQLIQMLGRARVQQDGGGAYLQLSHRRVQLDEPVVLEVVIQDPLLLQRNLPRISAEVVRPDSSTAEVVDTVELTQVAADSQADQGAGDGPPEATRRVYRAIWRPLTAGQLSIRVVEAALDDRNLNQSIEVVRPDDELRQPAADHARLAALAQETGGEVVPLDELARLANLVPNRARRTPIDIRESLWDSPLALLAMLTLLTLEWVGRKLVKLV